MNDIPQPPSTSRGLLHVSISMFAAGLILFVVSVVVSMRVERPWDPLGTYSAQTVASRVIGVEGPAAHVTGLLEVTGTKCAKERVKVRGSTFWQSIDPPGMLVDAGSGVAVRPEGCVTQTFLNPIPDAVKAAASRPDNPVHRWVITGTETPVRDSTNGSTREGTPRAWSTEEFEVIE